MMQRVPIDPDKGIDDLVEQLADDSKRLLGDEVRLAKMEIRASLHEAGGGAAWLGSAIGIAIIALVAFTLFFATLLGRVANSHYWVGAFITAALEIALGLWLLQRGMRVLGKAPYSLPETRSGLALIRER